MAVGVCGHVGAPALDADPGLLIKAGQTMLCAVSYHNTTAADAFIQLFDVAAIASVTIGTTVADFEIVCAANGVGVVTFPVPIEFKNGLAAFSTTAQDGSSDAVVDVWFAIA